MIYLFLTNYGIDPHTIKEYGKGEFLGEITEQEWEQADHIARMVDGKLFLGKTQEEKDREQADAVAGQETAFVGKLQHTWPHGKIWPGNLLDNDTGLLPGQLWRDGNTLKIKL